VQVEQREHGKRRGLKFFYGKETNHQMKADCFVHHRIVSAVERVEFVSVRVSYIVLRVRWINIILFECACTKGGPKDRFYKDFEQVFYNFLSTI